MGKHQAAKGEAAFLRGDVGVDGASTAEEQKDTAELERDKAQAEFVRGQTWLGRELLTWLLWRSDEGEPLVTFNGQPLVVLFIGRVVLRGLHGDVVELAAKGTLAPYSIQVKRALLAGLLVHEGRLRLSMGDRTWEATLDAEHLAVRSAKLPELLAEEDDERLNERVELAEQLSSMVSTLTEAFMAARRSKEWGRSSVPALKAWMAEGHAPIGATVAKAARSAR